MVQSYLDGLKLPDLFTFSDGSKVLDKEGWERRRGELKDILCREEYGFLPPEPISVKTELLSQDDRFCAGKAPLQKYLLTVQLEGGAHSFPVYCTIPKSDKPLPAFLHINFRDFVPDKYMPNEEICDSGFAVISFCYNDVTADNGDFTDGLAGVLFKDGKRDADSPGKIAMWAWAAMRVMDFIQTLDEIDKKNVAVVGHSRLGKTALLAGAFDERFACAMSNDSGCSGAAVVRQNTGETVKDIYTVFPFWFCENYKKYIDVPEPYFDQHFLMALLAPRLLYAASAEEDAWADPKSEFIACVAAGEVYGFLGLPGFIHENNFPKADKSLHEGNVGHHIRKGKHYFSRHDWHRYIEFMTKHRII